MFDRIGRKIKGLAKWTFIVEAIASVITGFILLVLDFDDFLLISLPLIIAGPLLAWVGSWLLYGFGEIIDKLTDIELNTRGTVKSGVQKKTDERRLNELDKLRTQGLITEEEYIAAINKGE